MIVMMIYTNLYHYMGQGPFMRGYKGDVDSCSDDWWKLLLLVNNFWPPEDPGVTIPLIVYMLADF